MFSRFYFVSHRVFIWFLVRGGKLWVLRPVVWLATTAFCSSQQNINHILDFLTLFCLLDNSMCSFKTYGMDLCRLSAPFIIKGSAGRQRTEPKHSLHWFHPRISTFPGFVVAAFSFSQAPFYTTKSLSRYFVLVSIMIASLVGILHNLFSI